MGRFSRAGDEPFSSRGLWFYLFSLSFSSRLSVSQLCLLSLNFYPSSLSSCVSVSLCLFSSQSPLSILQSLFVSFLFNFLFLFLHPLRVCLSFSLFSSFLTFYLGVSFCLSLLSFSIPLSSSVSVYLFEQRVPQIIILIQF